MNLQKHKNSFASLVLLAALFTSIQTPVTQAATAGPGTTCAQTVDNASDVTVSLSGSHCFIAFKAGTRTWTPPAGIVNIDLLVVAGGGGGGSRHAGGGGAGGLINLNSVAINGSDVNIIVGAGGAGGAAAGTGGNNGSNGNNSQVSGGGLTTRIAIGGGGGGYGGGTNAGGSGAGGGSSGAGGAATAGQGNPGSPGLTDSNSYWVGGGGGGAGETGTASSSSAAGSGGAGIALPWISTLVGSSLGVGANVSSQLFFAGGGGGGTDRSLSVRGLGGSGGGGAGLTHTASPSASTPGKANTGGGGGGSGISGSGTGSFKGGDGGSGVVVIRYLIDQTAPTFTNSTSFSFAENSTISTNAASITVNESSTITITSGTDSALFTLVTTDSVTARVRFLSSPNFESPTDVGTDNVYNISVRATDTNGNIANQSISITVTNVNEAPAIGINSSASTHSITQAENISSILTYTATDVDAGASLSFSISGTDAADFAINSSSGVLTFATGPDFEAPGDSDTNNAYVVVITVSDGALSDTQELTVTITNANESSSVGAPTLSGAASKGNIVTISVTSTAAGKVRFFLGGKRISTCLARSTTGSYPNYSATCSWKPPVTGRQNLTARVTPTDSSFSATTSAATSVWVTKRISTR